MNDSNLPTSPKWHGNKTTRARAEEQSETPPQSAYEKDIKYIYFQGQVVAHLQAIIYHEKEKDKIEEMMRKLKE